MPKIFHDPHKNPPPPTPTYGPLFSELLHFTESICYLICYAVTGIYGTVPLQYLRENT